MAENKNAQQVREITDKLEQGIKELFESERFKEYLRTMSKFYNYSFNNTLLIAMQKPEATYVDNDAESTLPPEPEKKPKKKRRAAKKASKFLRPRRTRHRKSVRRLIL